MPERTGLMLSRKPLREITLTSFIFLVALLVLGACSGGEATATPTQQAGGTTPTATASGPTPTPTSDIGPSGATATPTQQGQKIEYGGTINVGQFQTAIDPYDVVSDNGNLGPMVFQPLAIIKMPFD